MQSYYNTINTEDGTVELNWYEIGRVLATDNETDYVYVGDKDVWPGANAQIIITMVLIIIVMSHWQMDLFLMMEYLQRHLLRLLYQ